MSSKSQDQLQKAWQSIVGMRVLLFCMLLLVLYGFVMWRVQVLTTAEPTAAAVDSQKSKTSDLKIDPALVNRIEQLEETNVTVHSLFDQARKNPFDE